MMCVFLNPPSIDYNSNLEVPVGDNIEPPYKSDKNGSVKTNFNLSPIDIYVLLCQLY